MNETPAFLPASASELGIRLDKIVSLLGGEAESARIAAKSVKQLRRYIAGNDPPFDVVARLASAANVSLDWIVSGKGSMRGLPEVVGEGKGEIGPSNVVLVPFYEDMRASAGGGALVDVESYTPVAFSGRWLRDALQVQPGDTGIMRVKGDSMEPTIRENELLVFDTSHDGRQLVDGVFIFRLDGRISVKRLQRLPGDKVKIISDNALYSPDVIELNDGADFAVVGRVVFKFGRV